MNKFNEKKKEKTKNEIGIQTELTNKDFKNINLISLNLSNKEYINKFYFKNKIEETDNDINKKIEKEKNENINNNKEKNKSKKKKNNSSNNINNNIEAFELFKEEFKKSNKNLNANEIEIKAKNSWNRLDVNKKQIYKSIVENNNKKK
jgi:hypothetical protein